MKKIHNAIRTLRSNKNEDSSASLFNSSKNHGSRTPVAASQPRGAPTSQSPAFRDRSTPKTPVQESAFDKILKSKKLGAHLSSSRAEKAVAAATDEAISRTFQPQQWGSGQNGQLEESHTADPADFPPF